MPAPRRDDEQRIVGDEGTALSASDGGAIRDQHFYSVNRDTASHR
ncbi:hypothetical protein ACF07U_07740 [Streptomyces californicus]